MVQLPHDFHCPSRDGLCDAPISQTSGIHMFHVGCYRSDHALLIDFHSKEKIHPLLCRLDCLLL